MHSYSWVFIVFFVKNFQLIHCKSKKQNNDNLSSKSLDQILIESILPPNSQKCVYNDKNQDTHYTFDYTKSHSTWNKEAVKYEKDVFLAEMSNNLKGNQTWTIRIGKGGNIYSFRGAYGEAVPPQYHSGAIYVDEVTQSVSVNQAKNTDELYFIHQAGVYSNDPNYTKNKPFYSPNLAKHCYKNYCEFASWGQQAHLMTKYKSHLLYFNRYTDCGNGVMEYTTVIHNGAPYMKNNVDDGWIQDSTETVNYLNVPWSGVRESTLRDTLISYEDGKLHLQYPSKIFGENGSERKVMNTAGYTTFAEQVLVSDKRYKQHPYQLPNNITITLSQNPASHYSKIHSKSFHKYCVYANIHKTSTVITGCRDCNLWFQNKRTKHKITVRLVIHWAWNGNQMYFCPENINATIFNHFFQKDDEIIVTYANDGKKMEDNLALSFIHGFQPHLNGQWAPTRIRWGKSGSLRRDYIVYTLNSRIQIDPGETYVKQQYIATGRLNDMETIAPSWVNEVQEDIYTTGELSGTNISLYSVDDKVFGTSIGDCIKGVKRCVGSSVPGYRLNALFAISCANKTYVGSDKYFFSPEDDEHHYIRSYACKGESNQVRPKWKLLGYFQEGQCDYLKDAYYHEQFCTDKSVGSTMEDYSAIYSWL